MVRAKDIIAFRLFLGHIVVAPVARRRERFLDGSRTYPSQQIHLRARFVVGARSPGSAKRLLADDGPGRLVVDIEVARRLPQRAERLSDGTAITCEYRTGQRVRRGLIDDRQRL